MITSRPGVSSSLKGWALLFSFLVLAHGLVQAAPKQPLPQMPPGYDDMTDPNENPPYAEASQEMTTGAPTTIPVPSLPIKPESLMILAQALADNPALVNIKVHFTQELWEEDSDKNVAYLDEREYLNYIDPLAFTFARQCLGYVLLTLPFDYIPLSLASLVTHVSSVTIEMEDLSNPDYYLNLEDSEQLQLMFTLVETSLRNANSLLPSATAVNLESGFSICLDYLDDRSGGYIFIRRLVASVMNNRYSLFQSVRDCSVYPVGGEQPPEQYWFNRILPLIFSFLVFCFGPLALLLVFRKNPPFEDEQGTVRITSSTDLPVGLKHALFVSYNHNDWIKGFKLFAGLLILVFLSYMQPLMAYLLNMDDFDHRVTAAKRLDSVGYWAYIGFMLAYYVLFLFMFLFYVFGVLLSEQNGLYWESDDDRQRLTGMKLSAELWVPAVDLPYTQAIIVYARERMTMALDVRVWKYELWRLWDWITSGPDCESQGWCKYTFGIVTYIFLLIPYGFLILIRLFFNSLPSFYIIKGCFTDHRCRKPIGTISLVLAALRLPAIIWYIISILQCTFVGLVTNHEVVLPPLIIALAILHFSLKIYNQLYQDYVALTKDIISEVVNPQDNASNGRLKQDKRQRSRSSESSAIRAISSPTGRLEATEANDNPKDRRFMLSAGMPAIEMDLWYFVMNEIRSIPKTYFSTFLTLLLASGLLAIEFQFLWFINNLHPLGSWMFPFASILLALTLPILYELLSPSAMQPQHKEEDMVRIRNLIMMYYQQKEEQTIYGQKDEEEPRSTRYVIRAADPARHRYTTGGIHNAAFFGSDMRDIPMPHLTDIGNRGVY